MTHLLSTMDIPVGNQLNAVGFCRPTCLSEKNIFGTLTTPRNDEFEKDLQCILHFTPFIFQGTIGCTPNSVPMVHIGLI